MYAAGSHRTAVHFTFHHPQGPAAQKVQLPSSVKAQHLQRGPQTRRCTARGVAPLQRGGGGRPARSPRCGAPSAPRGASASQVFGGWNLVILAGTTGLAESLLSVVLSGSFHHCSCAQHGDNRVHAASTVGSVHFAVAGLCIAWIHFNTRCAGVGCPTMVGCGRPLDAHSASATFSSPPASRICTCPAHQ